MQAPCWGLKTGGQVPGRHGENGGRDQKGGHAVSAFSAGQAFKMFGHFYYKQCFPCGSAGKESACSAGDLGSMPGLGRSPREGKGYPLQYSGLENSMDCIVHGVAKSQTWLSDFHFHYYKQ